MSRARTSGLFALAAFMGGCVTHAPQIGDPLGVDANCGSKQARLTSVASVMASTDDKLLDFRPTEIEVRRAVKSGDGVIAYYNDQVLALPRVSKELGESDGYARVRAVGIAPAPAAEGTLTRRIFLLVRDRKIFRWIAMNAYDVQNVCVEGKRES